MNLYKLNDISELPFPAAVTVGMFDGVHCGHRHILALLSRVAGQMGVRQVVVTFDEHPRVVTRRNTLPEGMAAAGFRLCTNEERYALLEAAGVEEVVEIHFTWEESQRSACDFFRHTLVGRLHAKALVLGFDNMFGSRQHDDFSLLRPTAEALGVRVFEDTALLYEGVEVSSTQIRKALAAGDVRRAADMLGYEYRISGQVGAGRQVGRTIGFPTANLLPADPRKAMPAEGVYCVRCLTPEGGCYVAMANVGGQPTFGLSHPTVEVHLIGFDGNLYGERIDILFVERLRDICKFDSPQSLAAQLRADRAAAEALAARYPYSAQQNKFRQ